MSTRCPWVGELPIYIDYHDKEWGKPQFDSQKLFEKICLEGQQAGLSWITVLKKRAAYRAAFHQFDPALSLPLLSDRCNGRGDQRLVSNGLGKCI